MRPYLAIKIGIAFIFLFFLVLIVLSLPKIPIVSYTIIAEQNCDYFGGDWIIANMDVVCKDREINVDGSLIINGTSNVKFENVTLFINNGLFLNDSAKLILNSTTLTMNVTTDYSANITTTAGTNFTLINSRIKNNNDVEFAINLFGDSYVYGSIIENTVRYNANANSKHFFENSFFHKKVYLYPGSNEIKIKNITFGSIPCETSFFITEADVDITNSTFNCDFSTNENAKAMIQNSIFNQASFRMYSIANVKNSTFKNVTLSSYAIFNSTATNITNKVVFSPKGLTDNPKIYGNLSMPNEFEWLPGNVLVTRYYPIYLKDQFGRPLVGWYVNIKDKNNNLISEDFTDESGRVELNITFNAANYGQGNFSLNWNGTADINLANSTPIIIIENVPDMPPYWHDNITIPSSPAPSNSNIDFSIVWSDELNTTITTVLFENNFTGTLVNHTVTSNCYPINLTSIRCNLTYNLEAGVYVFRWYAIDISNNLNASDQWNYEVFKAEAGGGGGGSGGVEGRNQRYEKNETDITACKPSWICGPWSDCKNDYIERQCEVVNADELYFCLRYAKILPPQLQNLTKQQLIEKLKQGELAKYFGSYFVPPAMKKSCKEAEEEKQAEEKKEMEEQIPISPECVTPLLFFIILILFAVSYISYFSSIMTLVKKEETKKQRRIEKIEKEKEKRKKNFVVSILLFFLMTFFLIWLLLTFKCPEWYFVNAVAILLYIVIVVVGVVKYVKYWELYFIHEKSKH